MKTLQLSTDDIQNFSKLIYDPKAVQLASSAASHVAGLAAAAAAGNVVVSSVGANSKNALNSLVAGVGSGNSSNLADANMMAMHYYYLKQPANAVNLVSAASNNNNSIISPQATITSAQLHQQQQQQQRPGVVTSTAAVAAVTAAQQHAHAQQLLAQSQTQLKQLQLKQPTIHQHQQNSAFHHHPYYQQQSSSQQQQPQQPQQPTQHQYQQHSSSAQQLALAQQKQQQQQQQQQRNSTQQHAQSSMVVVHALNQNSNFSAASSSTGGGTASSHAPTQQSNTTGSSNLSPPGPSASARSTPASHNSSSASAAAQLRSLCNGASSAGQTKKLRTEPVLSQFHQNERLNFANTHIVWSEEHWKRVIFMDERKFNLDGPDGFSYYFHDLRNYERSLSQRPRGNSVYIYMVITSAGPLHLEVSTAKQKPECCIEAILRERNNIVAKLGGSGDFVLQDQNCMTNMLPSATEWLQSEGIKTQKWPTIAHDLNIMENIWGWMIREVYDGGRKFSRKDDLIFRIREAWNRVPMDFINNLYGTLPERITELYYTRGIYTNC